jgi:hypothetical protein
VRNKLAKLLRTLEEESGFENKYADNFGEPQCDYEVQEYIDFPNYRLVVERYNEKYPLPKHNGQQPIVLDSSIKSELKRMEMDGLIMIGTQQATKYAYTDNRCGPDYDEGTSFTSESIVLTTKGKNSLRYFIHKATENPVTTIMSFTAIVISLIALFL